MKRVMKKQELVNALADRTGFYKKNMKEVVEALDEIIIEHFSAATYEEPSELHIATGVVLCGRRTPSHESIDPRNRTTVVTPEKVVPYAVFKPSVRLKLYNKPKGYKKKGKRV